MGTSERRRREREQRRNAIMTVAEQIFFENGFAATTMEEIAEKTELAKGTLYLYFPNKDSLYHAIVLRGMDVLIDLFTKAIRKGDTGLEKIRAIGDAYAQFVDTHRTYAVIMSYSKSFDIPEGSPERTEALQSKDARLFDIMKEALETGQQDGSIRADMDTHKIAFLIALLTQSYMAILLRKAEQIRHGFSMEPQEASDLYFNFIARALQR